MCGCKFTYTTHTHTHTHTHLYIYIYICVCVCVCVCARARARRSAYLLSMKASAFLYCEKAARVNKKNISLECEKDVTGRL